MTGKTPVNVQVIGQQNALNVQRIQGFFKDSCIFFAVNQGGTRVRQIGLGDKAAHCLANTAAMASLPSVGRDDAALEAKARDLGQALVERAHTAQLTG